MLTQAEIDALLNGSSNLSSADTNGNKLDKLNEQEIDALGEIGNICMGSSATALFTLLGQKVTITTPHVSALNWGQMKDEYKDSYVAVRVEYIHGLVGANLLILKETDVKIMTDLMMGGDGHNTQEDLNDMHLSAISEAMNQMIGSAATSMSTMFNKRIDISPPSSFVASFENDRVFEKVESEQLFVRISFKLIVGNLIDSEIMQIIPLEFAKEMVGNLMNSGNAAENVTTSSIENPKSVVSDTANNMYTDTNTYTKTYSNANLNDNVAKPRENVQANINVQPAKFQAFDDESISIGKKNIGLIMDVPLEITVELGRTNKMIKEILEFAPGSIIELDKLAGEPVDILVNGKQVAKGEVVVIDESFGVRITDIADPSKRL